MKIVEKNSVYFIYYFSNFAKVVHSANVLEQLSRDGEATNFLEMIYHTNLNQVGSNLWANY